MHGVAWVRQQQPTMTYLATCMHTLCAMTKYEINNCSPRLAPQQ